ncbi:MAG: hypothetical protein EPO00_11585 [Chloroflexota bacterium]|nr:MAG: hypothetical protein EPO00_11585 [Chloroflexota bacterium]
MTLLGRDVIEVEALVTDRYLDALLMEADPVGPDSMGTGPSPRRRPWFMTALGLGADQVARVQLDSGVRLASERLTRDLPRFHPSFRFEERLAVRLAEAAASMHLPLAAGGESGARLVTLPVPTSALAGDQPASDEHPAREPSPRNPAPRPMLVSGAVAASALSLAGAAWVAWRRARVHGSPMARAARAAHSMRDRSTPAMRGRPA